MTLITSNQYDDQINSLAEEIRSLREDISVRDAKLKKKEELHRKTLELRNIAFPSNVKPEISELAKSLSMDFVPKKRRKLADYFPYIREIVNTKGSSHYKVIAAGLRESMKDPDIKDGYVYKILRGMEQEFAGVKRDIKEGYFMPTQGNNDVHSVGAELPIQKMEEGQYPRTKGEGHTDGGATSVDVQS